MSIKEKILHIKHELPTEVTLVAVSKTKPVSELMEAYEAGQRVFGENKIQEMADKHLQMPKDIQWHMIGHVQRNKVKYMASFVELIHAVDSLKLLKEIDKQAQKHDRIINCLLQIKIAKEETKFGLDFDQAKTIIESDELTSLTHVKIKGLMGMATFTEDESVVRSEFEFLKICYDNLQESNADFDILSMGMSGDYQLAINCGSNMVRIGSNIFGSRNY